MRDIAFVTLFVPMLMLSMRHIHVATMLWIWTALAGPNNYMFGFATGIPFNKLAVIGTIVSLFIDKERKNINMDAHMILIIMFLIQGLLSFSFGLTDIPRTYDLLDKMSKISILCFFMTMACRGRLQIHATIFILCLSLGITNVLDGLKFVASAGHYKMADSPTLGDNNYLALAGLMVLPLILYLNKYTVSVAIKILLLFIFISVFLGIVATASRGGLIGLVVFGLMTVVQGRQKFLNILMVGVFGAGLVFFAPAQWSERMQTIESADDDSSFMSRVISWKMHTLVALDRPLLGGGYSALEDPSVHAAYLPKFHTLDFIPTDEPTTPHAAHSIYFEALGDLGFVGLFLFLAILFVGYRNISRIQRLTRGDPAKAWAYDLSATFRVILIVFMVSGAALSAVYFEALYVVLTILSVLRWHMEDQATPDVTAPQIRIAHEIA